MTTRPVLIIDNYDSFVFNIARYFVELGATTQVVRNDAVAAEAVDPKAFRALVLSPGPRAPQDAGVCLALIRALSGRLPILGICLGHQCIGEAFGGRVTRAREPMHGRACLVHHDGAGLFRGLPNPLEAGRYHSLIVELDAATPLAVTARSPEGEIMALAHRRHPTIGVQFHPESILTPDGRAMLATFLAVA
jgi:para-aminobenzoate synthetase component 2